MGRPEPTRLGPFTGGINVASDPSAVADTELVDCLNFELDLDGSLICRPPIVETTNNSGTTTERLVMIGRAILAGGNYVFASNADGTYAFDGTTWTLVRTGLQARVAVQYQDVVYIVAQTGSANNGGFWDGAAWTTDVNMPKGEAAVFYKSRMFIVPGILATGGAAHQLRFTDPIPAGTTVLVWPAINNIPVSQGDGQKLVDIQIYNDNLMLFKQDSTYVLAYDILIADAILRQVNDNIGATTRKCVVSYENSVFVYHEGNVFEVVNYNFQRINLKVPFTLDTTVPGGTVRDEQAFICLFGDRLLVRYFNRIYCYGLRTKTWTRWESSSELLNNFGPLVEFPEIVTDLVNVRYFSGSSIHSHENIFVLRNGYGFTTETTLTDAFNIRCYILTKNYDFGDSHSYKRLAWWGIDVISVGTIVGTATPIIAQVQVFWSDLHGFTWGDLHLLTWNNILGNTVSSVVTNVVDPYQAMRKFIKFLKALRFRQVNFQVTLLCDGSISQGPARIFTLTAIVGVKQAVVKQVS